MKFHYVTLFLVLWPSTTHQRSHYDSPSYIAAVVQYSPFVDSTDAEHLGEVNARNYLKIVDKAATYGIDVIVFPESTLAIPPSENKIIRRSEVASYIPDPADKTIPCNDTSQRYRHTLQSMSCAAREHQIYLLINHREKVDCTPGEGCSADGLLIYNTNVAFDRDGRVIARYRKYHLYDDELGVNRTTPNPTTFKTDFGVTFGTFICFDVLFLSPALNLTRDLGITDILYSTHWHDTPPFYFAVEVQAAYAYAYDVNFMASGYSNPNMSSGGSGIYLGKQGYVHVVSENRRSNILVVSEIPKVINGKRTRTVNRDQMHIYEFTKEEISTGEAVGSRTWSHEPPALSRFTTDLIDLNVKNQQKTVCDRGVCCEFKLTIDFDRHRIKNDSNYYRYRFAVFNETYLSASAGKTEIKHCGIVACINDTKDGCGHMFNDSKNIVSPTTFTSLEISTPNIINENTYAVPITLSQKMIPLNVTDFNFTTIDSGDVLKYLIKLKKPANNLLSFAVLAHNSVVGDTSDRTNSASNNQFVILYVLCLHIALKILR